MLNTCTSIHDKYMGAEDQPKKGEGLKSSSVVEHSNG